MSDAVDDLEPGGDGIDAGGDEGGDAKGGAPDWLAGVEDEGLRSYVERIGAKDLASALKHGQNAEKFLGVPKERLMRLPERTMDEDPDAYKEILTRLGFPDASQEDAHKAYELKGQEGVWDFADDAEREMVQKALLDMGVRPSKAQGMADLYGKIVQAGQERQRLAVEQQLNEATAALKQEWGAAYDDNVALAQAGELAMPQEFSDWMASAGLNNNPHMIRLLHEVGAARQEGGALPGLRDGSSENRKQTPVENQASLSEFEERYKDALNNKGHPDHKLRVKERLALIERGVD